jgi:hypothetical protein
LHGNLDIGAISTDVGVADVALAERPARATTSSPCSDASICRVPSSATGGRIIGGASHQHQDH